MFSTALPPVRRRGNDAPGYRLSRTILATGDGRLEHQLQADMAVQKKRRGGRALRNPAWLKSIAWGKDDVLTAHHFGSAEAAHDEDAGGPAEMDTARQYYGPR